MTAQVWAGAASGCDAAVVVDSDVSGSAHSAAHLDLNAATKGLAAAGIARVLLVRPRWKKERASDGAAPRMGEQPAWRVLETDPVYGVTDDPVTTFVILMRSLPAVPILSETFRFQPVWHEDLSTAVLRLTESGDEPSLVRVAGPDTVTTATLYDLVAKLIDRRPVRVPMPDFVAAHGARLAEALQLPVPMDASIIAFSADAPALAPADNALERLLDRPPASIADGIGALLHQMSEVTPAEGVGTLEVKHFSVDLPNSRLNAAQLLREVRTHFDEVMPIGVGVEPAVPSPEIVEGSVITMAVPGRGHVQVRVQEVAEHHLIMATLRGHVVAGIVRFAATPLDAGVRFEIMTCDRAANALDWIALTLGGARIQDANWSKVAKNVAALTGHTDADVTIDSRRLGEQEAKSIERWIANVIERQRRTHQPAGVDAAADPDK